eukprot:jgi/Chlat1/6887/Chrsp51S06549
MVAVVVGGEGEGEGLLKCNAGDRSRGGEPFRPVPVSLAFVGMLTVAHIGVFAAVGLLVHVVHRSLPWWYILLACYVTETFALLTHYAGHHRWPSKWWYEAHMGHHVADYPPSRFINGVYIFAEVDNSQAYLPTMLLTPLAVCCVTGVWSPLRLWMAFWPGVVLLYLAGELHTSFHLQGSRLERFSVFQKLRTLHYYHHKGTMKHNYAIADFWLDWLLLGLQLKWEP